MFLLSDFKVEEGGLQFYIIHVFHSLFRISQLNVRRSGM